MGWTLNDMPAQAGRRAVVTGATGGLGYAIALALVQKGADVVIASRDPQKGGAALRRIERRAAPDRATFIVLDLSDLSSIRRCADALLESGEPIDMLVNNAGVMSPRRATTVDDFELQFGVNYLGHFALTARLMPALRAGEASRVVNVASLAHRIAPLDFADLQSLRYDSWPAYGRSKLAMIAFTHEFERLGARQGWGVRAFAAHPGWAATDLGKPRGDAQAGLGSWAMARLSPLLGQSAAAGALPILFAATDPSAVPGGYYGPGGLAEMRGAPRPARLARFASDGAAEAELWRVSETLTGASFGVGSMP